MNGHLSDDDLVLHYYGELEGPAAAGASGHLAACDGCRRNYTRLQQVLAAVDSVPAPALADGFERIVWARLEPALPARTGWLSWRVFSPANLAWGAMIVLLVTGAFIAGRLTKATRSEVAPLAAADLRERILLSDLGEHLDRSQAMLIELVSAAQPMAGEVSVDFSLERARAEELVAANRLYRQSAGATGDTTVTQLLDELERLLVELAASPDHLPPADMHRVQQQIAARDLLFKVRVVSTALKDRQVRKARPAGTNSEI